MALSRGVRSGLKFLSQAESGIPKSVTREFHATSPMRMGGHDHNEPYYLHAKHMYKLDRMKHQKLKVTLGVLSCVSIGVICSHVPAKEDCLCMRKLHPRWRSNKTS